MSRTVNLAFESVEQSEGAGARVRRSIGRSELRNFDPFLMLDEFSVKAPAGFPDHPHRGFETVTYMLEGETNHEDFLGHKGTIKAGDLQPDKVNEFLLPEEYWFRHLLLAFGPCPVCDNSFSRLNSLATDKGQEKNLSEAF
uniref:Pirin N-terminal domain-containing protein n=1 Tax=Biomphalaria glabrata TaxID=6526 RepID=A0A2C9L205_BIOGL